LAEVVDVFLVQGLFKTQSGGRTPFRMKQREDSGRRSTQLRGCPPPFGLLLYAAALSATPS
jgi:hypothetical protein